MERFRTARRDQNELYGVIIEMLGASRVRCRCDDGKIRICRIPGKLKKKIWMRENDIVIVEPWPGQEDRSADVIWRFTATESSSLRKRGELERLDAPPSGI